MEAGTSLSDCDQIPIPSEDPGMRVLAAEGPIEARTFKGGSILRIEKLPIRQKGARLMPASFADGFGKGRVTVIGEIVETGNFPVLLAHEQEGNIRRTK
jgi:hypothetical protein